MEKKGQYIQACIKTPSSRYLLDPVESPFRPTYFSVGLKRFNIIMGDPTVDANNDLPEESTLLRSSGNPPCSEVTEACHQSVYGMRLYYRLRILHSQFKRLIFPAARAKNTLSKTSALVLLRNST